MTDDLLERLVDWDEYDEGKLNDMREEAKARIEALMAERDEAREYAAKIRIEAKAAEDARVSAVDERARLQKAITDAGPYLERGLDKMAFNIIRAALKGETP